MIRDSVLVDTNAFVALYSDDRTLASKLQDVERMYLAVQSLGELVFGVVNSSQQANNRALLDERLESYEVIYPDRETAEFYGAACLALRKKGRHIPDNDLWIAALAMQHGLPVVTRDKHFDEVAGLTVVGW